MLFPRESGNELGSDSATADGWTSRQAIRIHFNRFAATRKGVPPTVLKRVTDLAEVKRRLDYALLSVVDGV